MGTSDVNIIHKKKTVKNAVLEGSFDESLFITWEELKPVMDSFKDHLSPELQTVFDAIMNAKISNSWLYDCRDRGYQINATGRRFLMSWKKSFNKAKAILKGLN